MVKQRIETKQKKILTVPKRLFQAPLPSDIFG